MPSTLKEAWDKYWEAYRVDRGSDSEGDTEALREPLIVKVYVVPTTPSTLPLRRTIEDLAQRQPFFAAVEDKSPPMFFPTSAACPAAGNRLF
jgi:hypothetical protein